MTTGRGFPDLRVIRGSLSASVRFAVSTRQGGASSGPFAQGNLADHVGDSAVAVQHNRACLARELGANHGMAVISAAHGAQAAWVSEAGTYPGVDALLTDVAGLALVALGADCAVAGIAAERVDGTSLVGVLHCGWRGLVADVVGALVTQIEHAGGRNLTAVLGPTICGSCYLVDQERTRRVMDACPPSVVDAAIRPSSAPGQFHLDIRAGVRQRLIDEGVLIESDFGCTAEDERWFSHRDSVNQGGPDARTGRHGLGISIVE